MTWIQENKFLAAWIAFVVLIGGLLAFLLLQARGAYATAYDQFDSARTTVAGLEARPLYPKPENVDAVSADGTDYNTAVRGLQAELASYQRPLRPVSETDFQADLKARVEKMNALAAKRGVSLPEGFALGMERYVSNLPPAAACPLLDFQLDSIDFLTNLLVDEANASSIVSFDRDLLPTESGGAKPLAEGEAAPMLTSFSVDVVFTGPQQTLKKFVNAVSNTEKSQFFHIIRLLRVENQRKDGPPRELATVSGPVEVGFVDDFAGLATEESNVAVNDAAFILGEEEVSVFARIELVRFAEPAAVAAAPEAAEVPQ